MAFVLIFRYIKKDTMRTMRTLKVYEYLINQGMATGATELLKDFQGVDNIEHGSLLKFLVPYYGEFTEEIFTYMQCHVTTTLTFD